MGNCIAQTAALKTQVVANPPKFLYLAKCLAISFDQIQSVIETNNALSDLSMLLRGKLSNNIHSMDQTMNFSKDELIKKLGERDYNELVSQIKNYSSVVNKTEPLTGDQFQSATLWIKLSSRKIDEIIVKLIR